MGTKNYTQVLIDREVYTLGDGEDESYFQKVVSCVDEKNNAIRKASGFTKQSADCQMVMTELNIADDYFKVTEWGEGVECQRSDMEEEAYSLKHKLVSTQIKLEAVLRDLEGHQRELDHSSHRAVQLEGELKEARENLQNLRTNLPAEIESKAGIQAGAAEEIEETVGIEVDITQSAPHPEPVSGSTTREAPQPETASQTLDADASTRQPAASTDQSEEKRPTLSLRVLVPASEVDRGTAAIPAQAAAVVAPSAVSSAAPAAAPPMGGMTDEELTRKMLWVARKAGPHKGGRR